MARQSRGQKRTIGRVMRERKRGQLKSGRSGRKIKSRRQAIAIALREAGASKYQRGGRKKSSRGRTNRRSAARRKTRSRSRRRSRAA